MIHGSMSHYPNGRKKSYNAWGKSKTHKSEFKPYTPEASFRRDTQDYPSASDTVQSKSNETLSREERIDISSGYTIAPAYNKGAYQVISRKNVEDIGR